MRSNSKPIDMKIKYLHVLILLITGFSAASQSTEQQIRALMAEQQDCWNKGDVDCFMIHYWNSPELVFIGGSGLTYGWQTTLDNYKKRYPDLATMGTLTFDILTVCELNEDHAFVIGKWFLEREMGNIGGIYSLVWRKVDERWVIISDHTSTAE